MAANEDQSTSKPGEVLSPGPLKMSDLETSAHEGHQLPPRRLEPITNPVVAKKRKRAKKMDKPSTVAEEQTIPPDTATETQGTPTLLGESMLSRLRSRLDPLYNASPPPPPSEGSTLPPVRLPPLERLPHRGPPLPSLTADERGNEQANVEESTSVLEGGHTDRSRKGSHRRTRQRKNDTQRASPQQPSDTQNEVNTSEQVAIQEEELKSTSRDALIAGTTGGGERKKRRRRDRERARRTSGRSVGEDTPDTGEEVTAEAMGERILDSNVDDEAPPPTSEDTGRLSRGRQLPAPPSVDGEDTLEPPISTMADELATTGGIPTTRGEFVHPDDPQFLVSEEDIVEVEPDELQGTTRLFQPVLQPHPSASQPKDVIFVERKDGRGFAAQRKDATPGGVEVERGIFSGERDISSSQFAIYSHKAIQHLAFIAHGLVAGISLWDCVVSNIHSRNGSGLHIDLLTHYHPLTLPANAIYVFLLSIVMLSLLDRFDFANLNKECLQSFFKTPVQIILLIASSLVFITLILTLSVAAIDERIALYPHQPSLWIDVLTPINTTAMPSPATPLPTTHTDTSLSLIYIRGSNLVSSRVTPWLALAIVRAICCCISWLLVVWTSDFDRLLDYLNSIEEESFGTPRTMNKV